MVAQLKQRLTHLRGILQQMQRFLRQVFVLDEQGLTRNTVAHTALATIGFLILQSILTLPKSDPPSYISMGAFAIAIPLQVMAAVFSYVTARYLEGRSVQRPVSFVLI